MRSGNAPRSLLLLATLACVAVSGCVSARYKTASAIGAVPPVIEASLGGAPLAVTLNSVIVFQGPGSWKLKAYWDELIVSLTNTSDQAVTLTGARLVDRLGAPQLASDDPWALEKLGLAQQESYRRAGVSFALNTLGYAAYTYGAVGAGVLVGAATTSTWSGMAAGATVGLAAVPVTALVVYAKNQQQRRVIEAEFHRRRWLLPVTLAPGETRRASLFFPMTLSPRELVLEWRQASTSGATRLPTPPLAGLHEPAAPPAGRK